MDCFYQITIRVPKSDSAFLYFTLEANEGVCFYSTLDHTPGTNFRDIEICGAPEFYLTLKNILHHLENKITISILQDHPLKKL